MIRFLPATRLSLAALLSVAVLTGTALTGPAVARAPGTEPAAAADVVRTYYQALGTRDYRTAYAQWGNGGAASGKSYAAFVRGFARTRTTRASIVSVGPPDGAAGSTFVAVGVAVDAVLTDGTRQHFAGTYNLRRVNDVPGATPDQLRWHIASASLHPASGG